MEERLGRIVSELLRVTEQLEGALSDWGRIQKTIEKQEKIIEEMRKTMKGKDKKGRKGC